MELDWPWTIEFTVKEPVGKLNRYVVIRLSFILCFIGKAPQRIDRTIVAYTLNEGACLLCSAMNYKKLLEECLLSNLLLNEWQQSR